MTTHEPISKARRHINSILLMALVEQQMSGQRGAAQTPRDDVPAAAVFFALSLGLILVGSMVYQLS